VPAGAPAWSPRGWAFSPLGFLRRVILGGYEDNITFLASGLTFDALLWVLPLLLVALSIFGYVVGGAEDPVEMVRAVVAWFLPEPRGAASPFAAVEQALGALVESRTRLTAYAAPFFVWFSWRLFGSTRAALNEVFDTEETRSWLTGKAVDLGLAIAAAVLISANTLITVLVVPGAGWAGRFVAGLLAYVAVTLLFFMVYTVAPSRKMPWDTALLAALVASLGFEIAKRLYGAYLTTFVTLDRLISNTNAIALLLFVLWVYLSAVVFLAGGEVAETYELARRQREQRAIIG
jgi:membrane protein